MHEFTDYHTYKEAFDAYQLDGDIGSAEGVARRQLARLVWKETGDEDCHESLTNSLLRYTRLVDQQQQIFEDERDYEALRQGLQRLPNITRVFALDDFSERCDWNPLEIDDHSWYHRRSQREIAVPVLPSPLFEHEKRDFRGIQSFIRALSLHGHKVSELSINSELFNAPASILRMDQDISAHGCSIAQRLDLLKVDPYYYRKYPEWEYDDQEYDYQEYDDQEYDEEKDCIGLFLSEAKNLRYLTMSGSIDIEAWMHRVWPRLETLILGKIMLGAYQLEAITQANKGTLREITFHNVMMFGEEGWADVGKEIGQYLRLRRISIFQVSEDLEGDGGHYLEDEAKLAVARSFMQSTPWTTVLNDQDDRITIVACPEE